MEKLILKRNKYFFTRLFEMRLFRKKCPFGKKVNEVDHTRYLFAFNVTVKTVRDHFDSQILDSICVSTLFHTTTKRQY